MPCWFGHGVVVAVVLSWFVFFFFFWNFFFSKIRQDWCWFGFVLVTGWSGHHLLPRSVTYFRFVPPKVAFFFLVKCDFAETLYIYIIHCVYIRSDVRGTPGRG
ncbi:unnamed protein product [Meganyctiphanes norvegica]|uniref:Secreted protein n=1 Tax=Meganyctiphanes norvegica TaxID=48144 RepID=A0AAV2RK61_MEGNR